MKVYVAITTDGPRYNAGFPCQGADNRPIVHETRNGVIRRATEHGYLLTEFTIEVYDAADLIGLAFQVDELRRYTSLDKFDRTEGINRNDVLARIGAY